MKENHEADVLDISATLSQGWRADADKMLALLSSYSQWLFITLAL